MRTPLGVFLLFCLLTIVGCQAGHDPSAVPGAPWDTEVGRDHPLVGRIWKPADGEFVTAETLIGAVAQARFVLLGEKHDNPDQHRMQSWIVARAVARGRRPAVAFEMLTRDQEDRLERHLAARPDDASGIGAAVGWGETGWPDWALYAPIAQAVLDQGGPVLAAGLDRRTMQTIARDGREALDPEAARASGGGGDLPPDQQALLRRQIIESHCDQLPEPMIGPMVTVQQSKDAYMAWVLIHGAGADGRDGAILIAGGGHARVDHGVPWHLGRMAPDRAVVAVGLLEVRAGAEDPAAYGAAFGVERPPFDFVWFTPAVDELDPCEKFADELRRAKRRHEGESTD